jgi:hypothetical protein
MTIIHEERRPDSPYIESVTHGWTVSEGSTIRPAECHWHMVIVRHAALGDVLPLVVGPLSTAGVVTWGEGAEILWIKFKLGVFMPHLSPGDTLNRETSLPGAARRSFWLKGSAWQVPDQENADVFVDRLVRGAVLVRDPDVNAVLRGHPTRLSPRTVRQRFLRATGQTHGHIRQVERAQQAAALLRQGVAILDAVHEAGYYDQPHLTRALSQFIGYTPAQIARLGRPA